MSVDNLLTGDELNFHATYALKERNGNTFYLGKLLERDKSYSPFHGTTSLYNNIFVFENMPDAKLSIDSHHNNRVFQEVDPGSATSSGLARAAYQGLPPLVTLRKDDTKQYQVKTINPGHPTGDYTYELTNINDSKENPIKVDEKTLNSEYKFLDIGKVQGIIKEGGKRKSHKKKKSLKRKSRKARKSHKRRR